jgi:regulator of sigma E protease
MLSIIAFLLTIGILVVVHEFGHYLVARLFRVKILTFSIGFGPKLFSYQGRHNEWVVSAILLGGYVRMLDEREGEVPQNQKSLAFNNKKPYQKILIALAGPGFNIIFAILAYYFMALAGVPQLKSVIASINPKVAINNIANLPNPGSTIVAINNKPVTTWTEADKQFTQAVNSTGVITLTANSNGQVNTYSLDGQKLKKRYSDNIYLETIGLYPFVYLPIIAYVEPSSVAFDAGLKPEDKIIAINGIKMSNWFEVADVISGSPGKKLDLIIERKSRPINLTVIPKLMDTDGHLTGKLGIMPTMDQELLKNNSFTQKYNWYSGAIYAINECYAIMRLNLSGIYQLVTGKMSLHNISGPVTIARVGKSAMHLGLKSFVDFLALISIGLAIMNLLPIPVLDGGHVVIYTLEWMFGREMAYNVQGFIFKIGLIIILSLSVFAIYNDLLRL